MKNQVSILLIILLILAGCATMQGNNYSIDRDLEVTKKSVRLLTYGMLYKEPKYIQPVLDYIPKVIKLIDAGVVNSINDLDTHIMKELKGHREAPLIKHFITELKSIIYFHIKNTVEGVKIGTYAQTDIKDIMKIREQALREITVMRMVLQEIYQSAKVMEVV